jgi:hypothetical protein
VAGHIDDIIYATADPIISVTIATGTIAGELDDQ